MKSQDAVAGARQRAHGIYPRLQVLLRDLPPCHPARPHLVAATEAARQRWADLVAAGEDRLLAQAPARKARGSPGDHT
jgi:hypothetical protein